MEAQVEILKRNIKDVIKTHHQLIENYNNWLYVNAARNSTNTVSYIKSLIRMMIWEIDDNRSFIDILLKKCANQNHIQTIKQYLQTLDMMAKEVKLIDDQVFSGQVFKDSNQKLVVDFDDSFKSNRFFSKLKVNYKQHFLFFSITCIVISGLIYIIFYVIDKSESRILRYFDE